MPKARSIPLFASLTALFGVCAVFLWLVAGAYPPSSDIKARYADLDSVEFIDSEDFLNYRGGALIFNTAAGAYFQGFAYGPPNNKGYLVNAADQ